MKYYIIAGEASGDLHAANMMKSLLKKDPRADFRFFGGDLMSAVGGTLVQHYKDLAFMGVWEVIKNIRTILTNLKFCQKDLMAFQPDVLILVDYPGFNLKIAEFAKKNGINVHYYISPKLWAWKEGRIKKIKKYVDYMYVIFPFEVDYFKTKHNHQVHFVGNPLLDEISQRPIADQKDFILKNNLDQRPIIALLPGSRNQEIHKMLGVMLTVIPHFKEYQFVIAGAPSKSVKFYQTFIQNHQVKLVTNQTYDLLSVSHAAMVTSGTATLETALFKIPQVVCYKTSLLTYRLAKIFVKIKFISLVNLVMDREIVKELIQDEFNTQNALQEMTKILEGSARQMMLDHYEDLHQKLGGEGASDVLAKNIIKNLS